MVIFHSYVSLPEGSGLEVVGSSLFSAEDFKHVSHLSQPFFATYRPTLLN
jgi:hypothetical protein